MTSIPANSRPSAPPVSVPMLDISRGNQPLREEIIAAITAVCDSGRFLHGDEVRQLEESVAGISQAQFAVSCASGSDALLLALMAFDIGPGDEVIVPSFTFFATASAVWRLGAKIVFADIDPTTFNLDPESFEAAITPATKAVIPVHLFGQCADMDAICDIAQRHGIKVIEDAAQAIGAKFQGRPAGSIGDVGCFSFYPTKNLGGFGDAGMLTTNDESLADRLRLFASHGMQPRYYHQVVGINSRMDTIQAAVLNVKLAHLEKWTDQRRANAAQYTLALVESGLAESIDLPTARPECDHVWNQYAIRVRNGARDRVRAHLTQANVGSEIYYPVPLHMQRCFRSLDYVPGSLPETERAAREVLNLPIFPELTDHELQSVVQRLSESMSEQRAAAA